jgi:hypothetical protein
MVYGISHDVVTLFEMAAQLDRDLDTAGRDVSPLFEE